MKELSYFEQQYNTAASARDRLVFKTIVAGAMTLVFWVLFFAVSSRLAMGIFQLIFTVLFALLCREELTSGLRSFLKFAPTPDSFYAFAVLAETAHAVRLIISDSADNHVFAGVLYLSVTASLLLKLLFVRQVTLNLDLIRDQKINALQVADLSLSKQYISKVCSVNPVVDFPNVVRASFDNNPAEKRSRRLLLITALSAAAAAILSGIIHRGQFFTALSSLFILCASFTAELSFILPYLILQIKLRSMGSILLGNHSTAQLKDANTMLIRDTDLFPPERNEILYFRIKNQNQKTKAEVYTATLLQLTRSPLEDAFQRFVSGTKTLPPKMLQWRAIRNYGVEATIQQDTVLLGNRHLLLSHGIQPWSTEREAMLTAAGVHLSYLAVNGEVLATMIFRYGENPELKNSVARLSSEFQLLVETRDCCINESMILRHYDLTRTKIAVPDAEELEAVHEMRSEQEEDSRTPAMLSTQNALGILEPICRAKQLERTVEICRQTQQISTLFGLLLTFSALLFFPGSMNAFWLFAFQWLWAIPVAAASLFPRK